MPYLALFVLLITLICLFFYNKFVFIIMARLVIAYLMMAASSFYLCTHDNVYSKELFKTIGGNNYATIYLVFTYMITILIFCCFFSRKKQLVLSTQLTCPFYNKTNNKIWLIILLGLSALFFIGCYVKLFYDGNIPLFAGGDRAVYFLAHQNFFILNFYKYALFISLLLGVGYYCSMFENKYLEYSFLALFMLHIFYFILIGNKFSALINNTTTFIIPLALFFLKGNSRAVNGEIRRAKRKFFCIFCSVVCGVFIATISQYYNRGYFAGTGGHLLVKSYNHTKNRLLVEQAQIWWDTFNRVCVEGRTDYINAWDKVFLSPIKEGHAALYYLMDRSIEGVGMERIQQGNHYTGAFPSIMLELFGPVFSLFFIAVVSYLCALLFMELYKAIIQRRYLLILFTFFVLQPVLYFLIGGKLSFVVNYKYYIKIALWLFLLMLYAFYPKTKYKSSVQNYEN